MIEKPTPISLETKLVEHWVAAKDSAERTVELADNNLSRIAMIYSGQLRLELPDE